MRAPARLFCLVLCAFLGLGFTEGLWALQGAWGSNVEVGCFRVRDVELWLSEEVE